MVINVAINGFGRIGRMFYRTAYQDKNINIIAVNDLTDTKTLAHLLKHDTVHGQLQESITYNNDSITIGKQKIKVISERDPTKLPWKALKIDIVVECTGRFTNPTDAKIHLSQGAKKILLSAPFKGEDALPNNAITLVYGVNHHIYNKTKHTLISNASCTTNCVAPLLKVVSDNIGIKNCLFTTIHAYTADQLLVDGPHKDLRRARAAAENIIPTTSGADIAVVQAIPELQGKLKGASLRVPVPNGSVTDFVIETAKDTSIEQINNLLQGAAEKQFKGIIQYSTEDLVSSDIIHNSHSTIVDSKLTQVLNKRFVKIVSWYDNEWGYSNRMVDIVKLIGK